MSNSARRPMSTMLLLSAVLGGAAFGAMSPSVAHAGDDACTTKKFNYPAVEKACKEGGRKAAKELMKGAVKKAKAGGADIKCTSCHEDTKDFKLKDNAVKDLKPLL
jgi:hypothetical protein